MLILWTNLEIVSSGYILADGIQRRFHQGRVCMKAPLWTIFVLYLFKLRKVNTSVWKCSLVVFASRFQKQESSLNWRVYWSSAVWNDMSTDKSLQGFELAIRCWRMCTVPKWLDCSILECALGWIAWAKTCAERGNGNMREASGDDCKVTHQWWRESHTIITRKSCYVCSNFLHQYTFEFTLCFVTVMPVQKKPVMKTHENPSHEKASRWKA